MSKFPGAGLQLLLTLASLVGWSGTCSNLGRVRGSQVCTGGLCDLGPALAVSGPCLSRLFRWFLGPGALMFLDRWWNLPDLKPWAVPQGGTLAVQLWGVVSLSGLGSALVLVTPLLHGLRNHLWDTMSGPGVQIL